MALARARIAKLRPNLLSRKDLSLKENEKTAAPDFGRTFDRSYKKAIGTTDDIKHWKNEKHGRPWHSTIKTDACPVLVNMKIKVFTHDGSIAVLIPIRSPKDETGTERGLMHREPNKTTWAYRRSDLLEKRRPFAASRALRERFRVMEKEKAERITPDTFPGISIRLSCEQGTA